MDRKKFGAILVALVAGVVLSAGSALAQPSVALSGYLMGDPAPGKLVPFYRVSSTLATIIGLENLEQDATLEGEFGEDIAVHVTVRTTRSGEVLNFDLCLSPLDFGFIVLQQEVPTATQQSELTGSLGRFHKARVLSVKGDGIPPEGYVTLRATAQFKHSSASEHLCDPVNVSDEPGEFVPGAPEPLATWAILQDVGTGFFATEIPTPTAIVDPGSGVASGGVGAFGLIPAGNQVLTRFDVNPQVGSQTTEIFVWLRHNASIIADDFDTLIRPAAVSAFVDCEDELELSQTILMQHQVNVIDPDKLPGIFQCKSLAQYRGVLRFTLPDTGFLWSQISQEGSHFRETFLGYNLENNGFIGGGGGVSPGQ